MKQSSILYAKFDCPVIRKPSYRVPKWWRHKKDFSEIMGFIQLFGRTYLKKVHMQKFGSLVH